MRLEFRGMRTGVRPITFVRRCGAWRRCLPALFVCSSALWWMIPSTAGRAVRVVSYQELFDKSDLVAIATPTAPTSDTTEQLMLPGMLSKDSEGRLTPAACIGVETPFSVSVILKGDREIRKFTLHHGRLPESQMLKNGPILVSFDPTDRRRSGSFLLFLVKEQDGRFAPTGGQTDPGLGVVSQLPFEDQSLRQR